MEKLTVELALEPAYQALNSLALLNETERLPALDAWVKQTASALSEAQRKRNALAFAVFRGALLIKGEWPDFSAYLDALAAQPPDQMRDRALAYFVPAQADHPRLIDNPEAFIELARAWNNVDHTLLAPAHALLQRPAELHDLLVSHLTELWNAFFAAEWARVSGSLENQLRAMRNNRLPVGVIPIEESLRRLVAPEVWAAPEVLAAQTKRVVYVNSPHTGRYITYFHSGETLHIFFNAVRNFPAIMRTVPVGRTELVGRLNALADETRLHVLELFAQQDALTAQDVMTALNLSQSNASRQLKALAHFLHESRGKGANKIYHLSPAQLELTFHTARALLEGGQLSATYHDARLEQPEVLRRYMNVQGKLSMLPMRHQDRMAALALIGAAFEMGCSYTEKQVNALIQEQIAFDDFVLIRRALCDYGFLQRERDGSRYWLADQPVDKLPISH